MEELFEFEVYVNGIVTDLFVENFINNLLTKFSLFWGGGYDSNKLNGVISAKNSSVDINLIIARFIIYFSSKDKIIIKVYDKWFGKIDSGILMSYQNVELSKFKGTYVE